MAGVELPVIVGSQSLYGVTHHVPDIVKRSVECDFLLLAVGPPAFRAVIEQIGFASSFQETHGYYADAVGLATVVLPTGWQERLVPLADEAGNLRAYCLEVHDTCVSKLMAGREKRFHLHQRASGSRAAGHRDFHRPRRTGSSHATEQCPIATPRKADGLPRGRPTIS